MSYAHTHTHVYIRTIKNRSRCYIIVYYLMFLFFSPRGNFNRTRCTISFRFVITDLSSFTCVMCEKQRAVEQANTAAAFPCDDHTPSVTIKKQYNIVRRNHCTSNNPTTPSSNTHTTKRKNTRSFLDLETRTQCTTRIRSRGGALCT